MTEVEIEIDMTEGHPQDITLQGDLQDIAKIHLEEWTYSGNHMEDPDPQTFEADLLLVIMQETGIPKITEHQMGLEEWTIIQWIEDLDLLDLTLTAIV